MDLSRRKLLEGAAALSAVALVPTFTGCTPEASPFLYGVASGDPLADRVILWTHVTRPEGSRGAVEVSYQVASDASMRAVVTAGTVRTDDTKGYAVKVDATGLAAGSTYYYRFKLGDHTSAVGRTKTLPTGSVAHLRFGMASCANFGFGYFHAYKHLAAREDLSAILFLGDYIYEFEDGGIYPKPEFAVRKWDTALEVVTLEQYRARYKLYRSDPDLQAAHAAHAWITTWDDHEVANDTWTDGAQNHQPATEGVFSVRKAAASQAMHEWLPIRGTPADPMYRSFAYGDLVNLVYLDTRHEGRDEQIIDVAMDSPSRHLISATQEAWLGTTLSSGTAQWSIIAQQVMVAPFTLDGVTKSPFFLDQWDGYAAARQRFYDIISTNAGADVVVLTGDIHGSFAAELPRDPWAAAYTPATGAGSLAVEFVCPGVTSPGFPGGIFEDSLLAACPHMKYADWNFNGYTVLDITPARIQADWYFVDGLTADLDGETWGTGYTVATGSSHLVVATGPAV